MKKWIMGFMVLATMSSAYAIEYKLNLDVKMNSHEFYQIEQKTGKYYRVYSIVSTNTHVLMKADEAIIADVTEPKSERLDETAEYSIQPVGRNTVRLIDQSVINGKKLNIDVIVKADIDRTFTGKVKSIKIASEEILALYQDVLEEVGFNTLRGMNIQMKDAEISTESQMKAIECVVQKETMSCDTGLAVAVKLKLEDEQ